MVLKTSTLVYEKLITRVWIEFNEWHGATKNGNMKNYSGVHRNQ
jgi:hypothetical protein